MNATRSSVCAILGIGRLTHFHEGVEREGINAAGGEDFDYEMDRVVKPPVVPLSEANVASSLLTNGRHAPCIDLDIEAVLLPSSSEGHSHLYINHELTWKQYKRLLKVMRDVGLVQDGFYRSALRRGCTLLRLPHVRKVPHN